MDHICEHLYKIGANNKIYGNDKGFCRVTGKKSTGIKFENWVRSTFNDYDSLYPGEIISNEALFCFDESSEIIQNKTCKDRPQRFRTYSHIINNGEWYCLTKTDKELIFKFIIGGAEVICLTDTGQKHIFFKHKKGMWQLDGLYVNPDIELLKLLHFNMCGLLAYKFSQAEIISGQYKSNNILKSGLQNWKKHEDIIKKYRGNGMFDFTSFMLFTNEIIENGNNKLNNGSNQQFSLF